MNMNKVCRSAWYALDHAKRHHNRLESLLANAIQKENDPEWVPSWSDDNQRLYAEERDALNKWFEAISRVRDFGVAGLCPDIALRYKHRKASTLRAMIHNNIRTKRREKWYEEVGRHSFLPSSWPNETSTPCPIDEVSFDDRLRQYDPFYGYSLSQAIQAETEGTVKMSAQIIDVMRTGGFVCGVKPSRILP